MVRGKRFIKRFETKVDSVAPEGEGWRVSYCSVDTNGQQQTRLFDAIMVCNGHYSVPLIPKLEGLDEFKGRVIHSHSYKDPGEYRDLTVVCLGGGASGQDISLDIATVAKQVILSHDKPVIQSSLPPNVSQQVGIAKLTADSAIFKNGETMKFDVLLLSTGYRYSFPFLSEECSPTIVDERMTPLYKHIVHAHYPSLFFIGMCKIICPFPQFDSQAKFILSILDGSQKLPSSEEMEADIEEDYQKRLKEGLPRRHAHLMGPRQWAYNDDLAKLGKFTPVIPAIQQLYNEVHRTRVKDLMHYKEKCYNIVGCDSYEEIENTIEPVEA